MRRRQFITFLGGAVATQPALAWAQQLERMRRIGVLMPFAVGDPQYQVRVGAFLKGLQQLGHIDGRNVRIEYRASSGNADEIRKYATELVALAPDVLLATGVSTVGPLQQATRAVPIVFAVVPDPVGAGIVAWPVALRAQPVAKLPTIKPQDRQGSRPRSVAARPRRRGDRMNRREAITLFGGAVQPSWRSRSTNASVHGCQLDRSERFAEIAAEFVRLKVDIIVTSGAAGPAVKRATSTIPIVLGVANDPVGEGLVTSLRRPGGNLTGLSLQAPDLAGKRLGLLHEFLPDVRRLAILVDIIYPAAVLEIDRAGNHPA
jgi:ABC-type uncharacterized transport system substrate-binding protein